MFQILKTKSGIIVLRTLSFLFFLFVCSDLEIKYLQCQSFESWMVSSFCCFYCTVGPTKGLYGSSNKLQCVFSEQNFPLLALWVSQGFYPKWVDILYISSRTLCCLWRGWLLWRGLMRGITISESGLGAHSETHTGKYRWMHQFYIFRFIFCSYLCLHISYFQVI